MAHKSNTFLEYLETDRFYDRIYNSIFSWATKNKEHLLSRINGYNVKYINSILDIELDYKNVWIDDKEGTKIDFDLAVEIDVEVEAVAGKHNDRDSYSSRTWVIVYCSGSLEKNLDDFRILGVEIFYKSKPNKPLSGEFVPYIKKSQYDDYANEILEKFYFKHYPNARENAEAIDVELLAKNMGLKIVTRTISKDGNVFGQIYFDDTTALLYNDEIETMEEVNISKNTMLVDENAAFLKSYGSRNMTIAHECVHSYYHRKAFLFAKMFNNDLHYIECLIDGTMNNTYNNDTADWMEIQANALSPCILMPKIAFEKHANKLFEDYRLFSDFGVNTINSIIDELADTFNVTKYAVKKRLIDLGYDQAKGAYNWVDNRYVRPYAFKKGSLEKDETFTISYKDVYKKVLSDPKLAMGLLNSEYVFVENHLVINHPLFVETNKEGDLMLSQYALGHMDECCVKFKYKTLKGFNSTLGIGLFSYLSRDFSKEIEFDLEITSNPAKTLADDRMQERYRIHQKNVDEVYSNIVNKPFREILRYLMDYLDISLKELEIDSGVNERTIRRYLSGENKVPEKRTVVALVRTLNLPYKLSEVVIKQAGITFINGDEEDEALLTVLTGFRKGRPREANMFLRSLDFDPLTKDE